MDAKERLRKFKQYRPYSEEIYEWVIDVTDYAKKFFGDIIESAEFTCMEGYTEERAYSEVDEVFEEIKDTYDKCGRLDCPTDGSNFIIKFTNGKVVSFWSGEGGGIEIPKEIDDKSFRK